MTDLPETPEIPKTNRKQPPKPRSTPCETCAWYDVIDDDGTMGCVLDLDEDEVYRERVDPAAVCHYYKFYDEYKSVQKQI